MGVLLPLFSEVPCLAGAMVIATFTFITSEGQNLPHLSYTPEGVTPE